MTTNRCRAGKWFTSSRGARVTTKYSRFGCATDERCAARCAARSSRHFDTRFRQTRVAAVYRQPGTRWQRHDRYGHGGSIVGNRSGGGGRGVEHLCVGLHRFDGCAAGVVTDCRPPFWSAPLARYWRRSAASALVVGFPDADRLADLACHGHMARHSRASMRTLPRSPLRTCRRLLLDCRQPWQRARLSL